MVSQTFLDGQANLKRVEELNDKAYYKHSKSLLKHHEYSSPYNGLEWIMSTHDFDRTTKNAI